MCVLQRERDAYVWNTLSSVPHDPKTALKGGHEKVDKAERGTEEQRQGGRHRKRFI